MCRKIERAIRKMIGKTFISETLYHKNLDCLYENDMNIEKFTKIENWHKTYIIVGSAL